MSKEELLQQLGKVERLATISKLGRFLARPWKYIDAIGYRELFYKSSGKAVARTAGTFFQRDMHLLLPASTDVYLTGGKSHPSEIRLAKFLIDNLNAGDCFVDVGAHYGYFTLLAATLVTGQGSVLAYEAAPRSFKLLQKNTTGLTQINIRNQAVSASAGQIEFYQFPNLYSEYNSIDASQFEKEAWFQTAKPEKVIAESIALATVFKEENLDPQIIKIDVEGAEHQVLLGLQDHLNNNSKAPQIVMEYLSSDRSNSAHAQAAALLYQNQYHSFSINPSGRLLPCANIDEYMNARNIQSDNIVFKRSGDKRSKTGISGLFN